MAWSTSNRRGELPPDWQNRRRRVLRRDRYCTICKENRATEVDHIVRGHDHSDNNLRGLCKTCHAGKSAREGATVSVRNRQAIVAARNRPPECHPGGW